MVKRLLVTTALEQTWSDEHPVLFLGEWCRLYDRRDRWQRLDALVVPYHWDDRQKLRDDYRYLSQLHERLLQRLAAQLNRIHGVKYSERYWRILAGPWLGFFSQALFDRWQCIQRAAQDFDISHTITLAGVDRDLIPCDMSDFVRHFVGDEWNSVICSMLLRRFTSIPCVDAVSAPPAPSVASAEALDPVRRYRRKVVNAASRAASALIRDRDAFILRTYLPLRDEVALHWRLRQVPQYARSLPVPSVPVDWSTRQWTLDGGSRSEFETIAGSLIPLQIPTAYLEGYADLIDRTRSLRWPKSPRVIFTSNAHENDDVFKAWAAAKADAGTPLVIGQHGGHFGIGQWNFAEDHDRAISDRYLSWGWREPDHTNVVPIGQLKARRPLGVDHASQEHALLVTCTVPRYSYWMYSVVVGRQYLDYLDDQYAFLDALPDDVRRQIIVRLYAYERPPSGWNQAARMRERLPDVNFDPGTSQITDLLRRSRLYISTYNATTFLESFTMNIPTVIYWDPRYWELRDSAIPYFEAMRRVGIFHETPQSAARHVASIWADVDGWWNGAAVRATVKDFTARYALLPGDLLDRVERALRDAEESRVPLLRPATR